MLRELTRPSPRRPLFSSVGAVQGDTAPTLCGGLHMMIDLPLYDTDKLPDDVKSKDLIHKAKATFYWPPSCLWPFMDHGPEEGT